MPTETDDDATLGVDALLFMIEQNLHGAASRHADDPEPSLANAEKWLTKIRAGSSGFDLSAYTARIEALRKRGPIAEAERLSAVIWGSDDGQEIFDAFQRLKPIVEWLKGTKQETDFSNVVGDDEYWRLYIKAVRGESAA